MKLWLGLAVVGSIAGAAPARADLRGGRAENLVDGGITLRVAVADPSNRDEFEKLADYGYDTGRVGVGLRLAGGFPIERRLDLGLAAEYAYKDDGSPRRKTIGMRTHMRQLGFFARPHLTGLGGRVDVGARLELGVIHSVTTLRQEDLAGISPYLRAQIEVAIGRRDLGILFQVGYLVAGEPGDFAPYAAPILGGISCGIGVLRRL